MTAELRPKLYAITTEMLRALYLVASLHRNEDYTRRYRFLAQQHLPAARWNSAQRQQLLAALGAVRLNSAASWSRAHASGILRIGTPGDYAPFAAASEGRLAGADIDLAVGLADSLGLRAVFVRTTWHDLIDDLLAGRFDVGIGGISVTPQRSAVAAFSLPTSSGGKTAIGRCKDAQRYSTLAAIDHEDVRVVFNPGGTNDALVHQLLHHATLRQFDDNRKIFAEIQAGRADVMFTDDTEVTLQTRKHAGLCRLWPDLLIKSDKAILMPRDPELNHAVNAWLQAQLAAGRPAQLLEKHLAQ
jgi:cyclohexadienyl dehydratase